jgi:hypothetical protein
MRRMSRFDVLGIVSFLLLAQACGGPTQPSKTAGSGSPAPSSPSAPIGTIVFVSASPAPGSDVVLNTSAPDRAQAFAATFSVTLDKAVPDVMVDVQLLDGADQSCGSGVSSRQNVDAGKAATFTVASITFTCPLPATVEKLKATVVTAASGQNTPTEYIAASFPARYAFRASTAAVTLSGTVTETGIGAISGATVEIIEGADTGRSTTTDATGRYTLGGLQPGPATVRASKDGYDNTYMHVTLSGASATQDLSLSKPIKSGPSSIAFLGSDPSPGSETVMTDAAGVLFLRDLKMQFSVQVDTALPDAKLEVQLFGDAGHLCAYTFVDQVVPANSAVSVSVNGITVWQSQSCNVFPVGISSVKATLLTLRGPEVNGRLQRTDYVSQSFTLRYTIRRYPDPPPNAPASLPVISELSRTSFIPTGGDPPLPGDPLAVNCTVREADGAPVTVALTLTWDGRAPKTTSLAFPAGASSSGGGARVGMSDVAPTGSGPYGAPYGKAECVGTNNRGESARKTLEIGTPPK